MENTMCIALAAITELGGGEIKMSAGWHFMG